MKRIYILFAQALLVQLITGQQQAPYFNLNEPLTGNQYYEARDYIKLLPGFEYTTASYQDEFRGKINPYLLFPPEGGEFGGASNNNNGGIVGTIEGKFSVTPNGTASYQIPLQLPAGINGMNPGLSVSYSSQGGEGLLGEGWRLQGLSVISRYPYTLYYNDNSQSVVFSNEDEFVLDGQHLIKMDGIEYRTENESFKKIVPIDGDVNNGFIVYHNNGRIYKYGSSNNSRQKLQSSAQPIAWYIDYISDVSNNYISFEYYNYPDFGFICPKAIRYTGNASTSSVPYYRVDFEYEENYNTPKAYFYNDNLSSEIGVFSQVIKRLTNIKCIYIPTSEIINEYELNFEGYGLFGKKHLTSITQYGSDGKHFNPTYFEWNVSNYNPIQYTSGFFYEDFYNTSKFFSSDFNRDGKDDLIHFNVNPDNGKGRFYIHMNAGYGTFNQVADFDHEFYYPLLSFQTGDFNGDAINDIFYVYQTGGYIKGKIMFMNYDENNNTFSYVSTSELFNLPLSIYDNPQFIISDFTGDGIMDCAVLYKPSGSPEMKLIYFLSTPSNPLSGYVANGTNGWGSFPDKIFAKDFDGDRKSEILVISSQGSKIFDLSLDNQIIIRYDAHEDFSGINGEILTGDFNKDGKADVLILTSDVENNVRFYHSHGKGFTAAPFQTISNIISGANRPQVVDLNGDGKDDLSIIKIQWGSGSNPDKFIRVDYLTTPTGQSFLPGNTLILQESYGSTPNLNHLGWTWCEIYNSGMIDMVTIDLNNSTYRTFCAFDKSFSSISQIKNGFGEGIRINYSMNDDYSGYTKGVEEVYPVLSLISGLPVVTHVERETGVGTEGYLVQFHYKGAKYHRFGKGFLGYNEFTVIDGSDGKTTTTYYSHNNPYYHVQKDSIRQWITSSSKLVWRELYSNFYYDYEEKRYLHYIDNTQSRSYNLSGQLSDFYYQDFQYVLNASGIPIKILKNSKNESGSEWVNKFEDLLLLNLTSGSKWILGLHERIETKHTSWNESPVTRLTMKEYYNQTGQLKNIILEPSDNNTYNTSYVYDIFGNIVETKFSANEIDDRINISDYSPNGRFLKSSFNPLNHETKNQYYYKTGNVKKITDVNGLETNYYYDGFGRINRTIMADSKEFQTVLRWATDHPDNPPNGLYYVWSNTSGQTETIVFFDKLGRELRKVTIAFDGGKIYTDQEYYSTVNLVGLVKKISNPYFKDNTPYYKSFTYDALRRKQVITNPDDVTTSFLYGIMQVTTTVVDGTETRIKKNILDAAGRIKESIDVTNGKSVKNNYFSNGLLKETWVNGYNETKITYHYDIFGNLITIDDPNMGLIAKSYNAFGELISETDGNGFETGFEYDLLGRIITRTELDGITNWYYDTQGNGIGKIHYVTCDYTNANGTITSSNEEYFYDELSRYVLTKQTIDGETLAQSNTYDIFSRVKSIKYPSGFILTYHYNEYGYLGKVADPNHEIIWKADVVNSVGMIQEFSLGQAIHSTRVYQPDNFRILSIQSGKSTSSDLQNLEYAWKGMGNLHYRRDVNKNLYEFFTYDDFYRLTHCKINNDIQLQQSYDGMGNLFSKSDVGIYQYGQNGSGPNAVTKINPTPGFLPSDQFIEYTSFNKIAKIEQGDKTLNMTYGFDYGRIKQVIDYGNGSVISKTYLGSSYEKIEYSNGTYKEVHYLSSPVGVFGVLTIDHTENHVINYLLKDHLGSVNLVLDVNGNIVEEVNYDAWGRLRNPITWTYTGAPSSTLLDRGYTMHEHLYDFGLINMNGRVFDPVIARFLSPDPYIQEPGNTQNHNRYSYGLNNPLKYTDPTGYSFINALEDMLRDVLTVVSIPGRVFSAGNEWLNDQINGTPDPNGYFSLHYIGFGILPAPDPGFIGLFESNSGASYGSRGGFASADGTFHSHDAMAKQSWTHYAKRRQAEEQGDYNNMDIAYALNVRVHMGNLIRNAQPGLAYYGSSNDLLKSDGDETVEEKVAQGGGNTSTRRSTATAVSTAAMVLVVAPEPVSSVTGLIILGVVAITTATISYWYDNPFPTPWYTDRPQNYIPPPPNFPSGPSGGDDWIKWLAGGSFAGGTAYLKYRYDQTQRLELFQTIIPPQDNTYYQPPVIRPYNAD